MLKISMIKTYDKIYTIDLHGNSKKKETCHDGSKDENIFDIMQDVSINIFVKTGEKKRVELAEVYHYDLYGKRNDKYEFLAQNSLRNIQWSKIENIALQYYFVQKDWELKKQYEGRFSLQNLFPVNSVGIVAARDKFTIHDFKQEVQNTIEKFLRLDDKQARAKFHLGKDVRDWKVSYARADLEANYQKEGVFAEVAYRPFDKKWTFYTGKSKGFHCYPRNETMKHMLKGENVGIAVGRQSKLLALKIGTLYR